MPSHAVGSSRSPSRRPAGRPCDTHQLKREYSQAPRPKAKGIYTVFQSDSSSADSAVRVRCAQPRSRLKPEVRKRKTPSRGLRSASHSWPYACAAARAARAAPAGRPLLHDRSVLRQARIADRICRRSCLHNCTPLHAASDVSDVLSPLTVACFRRARCSP
jgi:hypothetical protein